MRRAALIKISNKETVDVLRYTADKILIVEKRLSPGGAYQLHYYIINLNTGEKEAVTKSAYLLRKFGREYENIVAVIKDYAQCEAATLSDKSVFVIFPNGQCGLFDAEGKMQWSRVLSYNEHPVSGLATDGDCFWCVCPEENCVVRFSFDTFKSDIRIGAKDSNAFENPCFISDDDELLYVCCSNKLRCINKKDLSVSDLTDNTMGIKKFYCFGKFALISASDGTYLAKDE